MVCCMAFPRRGQRLLRDAGRLEEGLRGSGEWSLVAMVDCGRNTHTGQGRIALITSAILGLSISRS